MSSTSRAWVRENNPNVYVKGRFDVTHIPKGDPDCRLGVKKSSNQEQPDPRDAQRDFIPEYSTALKKVEIQRVASN